MLEYQRGDVLKGQTNRVPALKGSIYLVERFIDDSSNPNNIPIYCLLQLWTARGNIFPIFDYSESVEIPDRYEKVGHVDLSEIDTSKFRSNTTMEEILKVIPDLQEFPQK